MNLYQSDVQVTVFVAICRYEFIVFQIFYIVCPQQVLQPGIIVVAVDRAKFVVGIMVLDFHMLHRASRPSTGAEQPASDSKTNSNNINFFIRQSDFSGFISSTLRSRWSCACRAHTGAAASTAGTWPYTCHCRRFPLGRLRSLRCRCGRCAR